MKERINKLARGIVEQEMPRLVVEPESITGTLTAHTVSKGEFHISSANGLGIKGILYSTHDRVKTATETFHKLQNDIAYEVNTEYMENGDTIEGAFHVVTNAGEVEIPYSFHVCLAAAGKVLESLDSAMSFAAVAKADWDTARNLFVYRNFTEAPFMKDIHVRTIYDGLLGGPDEDHLLEQFLIALHTKEAVKISADTEARRYVRATKPITDTIRVKKDGWGYIRIRAWVDGAFLSLPKDTFSSEDFEKETDTLEIPFEISPEYLHGGRNFGCIYLCMKQGTIQIPVEADARTEREGGIYRRTTAKQHVMQYLKERLFYECGGYTEQTAWVKMQDCVEQMENARTLPETWTMLLKAEVLALRGQGDKALLLLNECHPTVNREKEWNRKPYTMYQYLHWKLCGGASEKEALIAYLNRCMQEEPGEYLYLYFLEKVDETVAENIFGLLKSYRSLYYSGCRSPFLYVKVCWLFIKEPELFRRLEAFEFQSLWFGKSFGLVEKDLAVAAAKLAGTFRTYRKRYFLFFASLYERYQEPELLYAVLGLLIKGDVREPWAFVWYERGVKAGIALTRLYEYYLYTLPEDCAGQLPREIFLYFSYESVLEDSNWEKLYENLILYWKPDSETFKLYGRAMEQYMLQQLFASKINRILAILYDHMLYPEMIDLPVAKVLPSILKSCRIVCTEPQMKYVIVCCEELNGSEAYPLKDGEAFVTLYSDRSVILFQDSFGNRCADVQYQKIMAMDHPEFLKKCFQVYPEHAMLRLSESRRILEGPMKIAEIPMMERILQEMNVKTLYRQMLLNRILSCYQKALAEDERLNTDRYLLSLPKSSLSRQERTGICRVLIAQNHIAEAFEMVKKYHMENDLGRDSAKLVSRLIADLAGEKDELLLSMAFSVFQKEMADHTILDYLSGYYNGTVKEMYDILEAAIREKVETYDLEERLLGQILFTGAEGPYLDTVFEWYTSRKKQDNTLVKAYFTTKCVDYFLNGTAVTPKVFTYLESMVRRILYKGKIPDIYQLALTRYYSEKETLSPEEGRLCAGMIQNLLAQGKVFPYYQKLVKWAAIPDDIMDKAMMEYHGQPESRPVLWLRVLPDEEEFHAETMHHMYKGIFVKEKVLFADETMEYQVLEEKDGQMQVLEEGKVSCQRFSADGVVNRITCINDICRSLSERQEEEIKKKMRDYAKTTAIARTLFELL